MDATPEIRERLSQSALPDELKISLIDLFTQADAMLQKVPRVMRPWRLRHLLKHLADEVVPLQPRQPLCDPATPEHWWELTLYLLVELAESLDPADQSVIQCVEQARPKLSEFMGPYGPVTLEKITDDTMLGICMLSDTLRPPQAYMVAPNVMSLAQAHFNEHAWFRAIYAGKAPVGFLMIVDDDQTPEYFLWRFMIASYCQGRGYGRGAIERLVEYVRTRPGARELGVSCGVGEGSPEGFYRQVGFVPTGKMEGDEMVLVMQL